MFTDPSGYFSLKKLVRGVVAIAAAFVAGPAGYYGAWVGGSAFATSVVAGGISGAIASGNSKGFLQGALAGGLFYGAGQLAGNFSWSVAQDSFGRALFHAGAGCLSSMAGGDSCGRGALNAGFTKYVGANTPGFSNIVADTMKWAVIGGTVSTLGGGSFANGAATGAFQYLFNELLARKDGLYRSGYETRDSKTNERIWALDPSGTDPTIKMDVVTAINVSEADGDGPLRVAQGFRTIAEQDALYAQGRTTAGNIVTYARGGESIHNLGHAVDVFRITGGQLYPPSPSTVETFKRFGFSWGGDWKGKKMDLPHFER
ncbi:Peptidoglycan L-alanyl-D-glutamate endopeptidase CwlK precursor [compost metagenome]